MAWNLTLQDASFRGVSFEVQSVEDRGEKALCVHEYPYRSGAEVEDLGRKPRVIPVTAIFWGVAYESRIKALVAAFRGGRTGRADPSRFRQPHRGRAPLADTAQRGAARLRHRDL